MDKDLVRTSKFLSYVLRHRPDEIGLSLDEQGWVAVETLLAACASHGRTISRATLERVVSTNDKQRFSISPDGARIRANQGHSVSVDLGYEAAQPPSVLFHGTAERNLASIRRHGLRRGNRHHVHLSADVETARSVGSRYGRAVMLRVRAADMTSGGAIFYLSANGVWLTESVPPAYLEFPDDPDASAAAAREHPKP